MKKTTIMQVIPELNTGGAELSTLEMTQAVVAAGGRALVVTEGGRLEEKIIELGGEIVHHPVATKNPVRIYGNASFLETLIKTESVDLVHARSRAPAWSAWIAARRTRCPFVTTYHGAYGNREPFKNHYNRIMARGDIVIANSEYTANLVRKQHNPPEARLRVIHRGVDPSRFNRTSVDQERLQSLKDKWNIRNNRRIILQAARLTGWKGQEVLISAVARIKNHPAMKDAAVVLAGDEQGRQEYRQKLLSRIVDEGLSDLVYLTGHCEDMPAALAVSHISVVASIRPEAFGRAAIESQALGCPVIVTNIGAAVETVLAYPEVSEAEITGWRIPPGDPAILADVLVKAMQLPEDQRDSMGLRAQQHVALNFSLGQMKARTLQVYDELIGSNLSHALEK